MKVRDSPLPRRALQSALRSITERLAQELASPSRSEPQWSPVEWRLAQAVAAMHGVAPVLDGALVWAGPEHWREFLGAQRIHTRMRQQRIHQLLGELEVKARADGIAIVALKGAALHASGVYVAGERPMADIDLLVASAHLDRAARWFPSLGYHPSGRSWKHHSFDPNVGGRLALLGEHADAPIKIDLHCKIAERLPQDEWDFSALVFPQRAHPGINPYPSLTALFLHVLAHAAGTMVHRGIRLIQLLDVVRLAARMGSNDWHELCEYRSAQGGPWWALPPLLLTARYFQTAIPSEVVARLTRECPWLLRRASQRRTLSDVSYSHVAIDPIPGIVWTRSAGQMFRYVMSRIHPSDQQLDQLSLLARTEPWASEARWFEQSQLRRITDWATSRPARTETMQTVRAALGTRL
jgi:hypothetical protein